MYRSGAIKISEFGKREQHHNGDHAIHVILWWCHGKHHHCCGAGCFTVDARQPASCSPHLKNCRSKFWTPIWQGGIILDLQSYFGPLIMTNNPTPWKIVQSSGEMVGSHFDIDCFTLLLARHLADVSCFIGPSMPSGICMEIHTKIVQKQKKKPSHNEETPRQPHVYF